jgi:DNA modification methylase
MKVTDKINILHGDCLEVLKLISDKSIDAIITDPPYGTTVCKWDNIIPFDLMWEQLNRIIKPNGAIVLFGSQPFTSALIMSNVKNFKYNLVWNKKLAGNFLNAKNQHLKIHEDICIFSCGKLNYYPIMIKGKARLKGSNKQSNNYGVFGKHERILKFNDEYFPKSIIEFSNAKRGGLHPTQKPVSLIEYLIKTYTKENETILDFTMGSGTTGVACKNLDRKFLGIEKDGIYFKLAKKRIENHIVIKELF